MPNNNDYTVAIVTNVIPLYREDMYTRLIDYYGNRLHIYCQNSMPGMNLRLVHDKFRTNTTILKAWSLKKEKFSWQWLPLIHLFRKYDVIYFYGNPRVFSNVIFSYVFKLLGKKIVIWGQYHTAGAHTSMENIRLFWWKQFKYVFLYTDKEADEYRRRFPKTDLVFGMNNGINIQEVDAAIDKYPRQSIDQWLSDNNLSDKKIILSCARLDKKNRFDLFMECMPKLINEFPDLIWCIIGKGDEEEVLKQQAIQLNIQSNIVWLGAVYEQEKLAPWFLVSQLLVHPSSIGLSLIHSMCYGLPVLTHNNIAMQGPEIAALEDGINGFLFEENNADSMVENVKNILEKVISIDEVSKSAKCTVRKKYNTKIMADKFIKLTDLIFEPLL